ncbi:beta-mannosidase [Natronoflexus pectinivorans]|uniref:Beta-mannosidase B n=1 Tax=Natronoflexus pectinivorans TaxID=682526 RepID=A0A4R2GR06_9BACT|nr:glycoside hydrolase family 2 protein [Natronoflexus pectinivorans]TCO10556.1 beta-mannosidase [Natronoflexus pectinivorans]
MIRKITLAITTALGALILLSCETSEKKLPMVIEISQNWTFTQNGQNNWMPAVVPGTVHADLMNNGIIEDPHYRLYENDVQWIENEDWIYQTTFNVDSEILDSDVIEMNFKGLDTYADVFLNNNKILSANNMFVGYSVDVKEHLVEGVNTLRIYFHSPVRVGMKKLQQIDYIIPSINEQAPEDKRTSVFTRKAPFHYGWDWGPRLVTSGIWRPIYLKAWNQAKIEDVYFHTTSANSDLAKITGHVNLHVLNQGTHQVQLFVNGQKTGVDLQLKLEEGEHQIPFDFEIKNPKLWWTNGLGEPHLYNFELRLAQNNVIIDKYELNYGVRTLRLIQEPDEVGRSFYFELNGVPVFMKGANVIPSETLTPSVTTEVYERLLKNTVDANMNMLRVWGGAIYEEDLFYELCDQNGILIWQDFMFACNLQPGDEAHLENIRKEAVYNVKRLRNHACIALWCGNNENLHGWHEWGWKEMYTPEERDFMWRTYERIWDEILPEVVAKYDPKNSYWASSPMAYGNQKADRKSGDEHDWTIWFGQEPFTSYGKNVPRFVSEYGMQAFPGMHTISDFSEEGDWDIHSEVMRHRQRGTMEYIEPGFDGNDMIKRYMERYYNVPDNFEDFVYVSQIMHAKCYRTALEAHRRNMPHCMGSLYWQINDSWPTISWATVDYYGRWKAAHYAVRKANKEIIISAEVDGNAGRIYVVSDRLTPVENARLHIKVMDFSGREIFSTSQNVTVKANSSMMVMENDIRELQQHANLASTVVSMKLTDGPTTLADNIFYFHKPKDLLLPEANITWSSEKTTDGYTITVTTDNLAKNLFFDTPYGDVFFTDNFFDLLPGESKTIKLITKRDINLSEELDIKHLNGL